MAKQFNFDFLQSDDGLGLRGYVNFPNDCGIDDYDKMISVRGLGEWRHVPANVVNVSEGFIEKFKVANKSQNLSKIGMNYIGLKAKTQVLVSYATRKGKNGKKKVTEQLTKFFKAIGASSVHIEDDDNGGETLHE